LLEWGVPFVQVKVVLLWGSFLEFALCVWGVLDFAFLEGVVWDSGFVGAF
jgi:hypothetical protein